MVLMEDQPFYIGIKALIIDSEGKILLLRKVPTKPADKWEPFWDIPGGKIQNQSIKNTLIREIKEEIGVRKFEIQELFGASIANFKIHGGKDNLLFVVYKCKIPDGAKLKLSKEHDQYKWTRPKEAKQLLSFMLPGEFLEKLDMFE